MTLNSEEIKPVAITIIVLCLSEGIVRLQHMLPWTFSAGHCKPLIESVREGVSQSVEKI